MKQAAFIAPLLLSLLALTGCGSGAVDAGGFSSSLRGAAQKALDGLQYSAVPGTIGDFNTPDAVLSTCTLHVVSNKPLVFRLFMDWKPRELGRKDFPIALNASQIRIRYSWLSAIIPTKNGSSPTLAIGQIPATLPIPAATRRLESAQGSAFVKPLEECELLPAFGGAPSGALRGFPYGNISNPLSTTTVPPLTG